jgi:hypothetical protein
MTSWGIIRAEMPDGSVEFQVSDGPIGNRSTSYDFDNLKEAEEMLSGLRDGYSARTPTGKEKQ